ncbi:MOSC domain-containing protein [Larsenimonas salina]|uniref:MOSC domain-containing protein n=1 Tax=Larsenimonas salina TaxID=1295565 RepID=UPI002073FCB1|nr:MOSC N-terminal beta barrel domain-containing protein [Larsenimonas salina]MCM5704758.1 MOSC N-terminal beta barrel domain-containing protein [Larsenimonas salina]
MAEVAALYIYPVKSMAGVALESAELTWEGLALDRRWMVISETSGQFMSQRVCPAMATLTASVGGECLVLSDARGETVELSTTAHGPTVEAMLFKERVTGIDQGDEVARWLTERLGAHKGEALRLIRVPENNQRRVEPDVLKADEVHRTGFADGFPFLVAFESSLEALNARINAESPLSMNRFRPNIVLKGDELAAWSEHGVTGVAACHGQYALRLCKPCKRCKITTVDQARGVVAGKEPLKTLATMGNVDQPGAFFGENAVLEHGAGEVINVGDAIVLDGGGQ